MVHIRSLGSVFSSQDSWWLVGQVTLEWFWFLQHLQVIHLPPTCSSSSSSDWSLEHWKVNYNQSCHSNLLYRAYIHTQTYNWCRCNRLSAAQNWRNHSYTYSEWLSKTHTIISSNRKQEISIMWTVAEYVILLKKVIHPERQLVRVCCATRNVFL